MAFLYLFEFSIFAFASFLFAGFETGFISWNSFKLTGDNKSVSVRLSKHLLGNRGKLVSTVLIGNNIALVGMSMAFTEINISIFKHLLSPSIENIILTFFALLFCELFPKSLFRIYSYKLTLFFVPIIYLFYILFYPISLLFSLITSAKDNRDISSFDRLISVAQEGARLKNITAAAGYWQRDSIKFSTSTVKEILLDIIPFGKKEIKFGSLSSSFNYETQVIVDMENMKYIYKRYGGLPIKGEVRIYRESSMAIELIDDTVFSSRTIVMVKSRDGNKYYLSSNIFSSLFIYS